MGVYTAGTDSAGRLSLLLGSSDPHNVTVGPLQQDQGCVSSREGSRRQRLTYLARHDKQRRNIPIMDNQEG